MCHSQYHWAYVKDHSEKCGQSLNPWFNYKMARVWHPLCYPQLRNKPPAFLPHDLPVQVVDLQDILQTGLFCLVSGGGEMQFIMNL